MSNVVLWLALLATTADAPTPVAYPQVLDPRLKIELLAAEPDIVTPTGLAVDAKGRVLVVESHTHFRPPDYQGPAADRIRILEDADHDGRAERVGTFYEGTTYTMNVCVHTDGSVYVATRNEIFRLRDTDHDDRADERTTIARLETTGNYPHNGLSGFAFDFDGNVYFGLGENLGSPFKLIGTDGSVASDLEGGQIYRCRADGSQIEMVAFGFWNPFHVALDTFGRLFAVDNDPDSLPPCRLTHIVEGGNYGYRYRNGRKGVHPFTAWNGELPGTLPMVSGTGEAPSGVIAYESDHLPEDYVGDLLLTSWGDHRIERHRLEPRGASFQSVPQFIVQGDENFRPVGIAAAPDGSLYVSDWVLRDYDLHRHGRVWRISAAQPAAEQRPTEPAAAIHSAHRPLREAAARKLAADKAAGRTLLAKLVEDDPSPRVRAVALAALHSVGDTASVESVARSDAEPGVRALAVRCLPGSSDFAALAGAGEAPEVQAEALRRVVDREQPSILWDHVTDLDAFVAAAARVGLARSGAVSPHVDLATMSAPERLAALLVLRESHHPEGRAVLQQALQDADGAVRFAAIQWVGEDRLTDYRGALEKALTAGPATSRLFGGYLAALERLDGVTRTPDNEWSVDQYIVRALDDPATSPEVLRWSLRMLRPDHEALSLARLETFLSGGELPLQLEAVRTLRDSRHAERAAVLARIAGDDKYPLEVRAEAIVGMAPDNAECKAILLRLAQSDATILRDEALRSLRGGVFSEAERRALESLAGEEGTREMVARILRPDSPVARPAVDDLAGWLAMLEGQSAAPGNPRTGERIFFHARSAACSRCHQMLGRGARIGPELTATAARLTRARLVESIVRPGKEVAPHFATWQLITRAGTSLTGMLVKEEATGEQTYADSKGVLHLFKAGEIENRRTQSTSIMPDGLPDLMTTQEFRDLLAFLQSSAAAEP
ncbi:MAG: PVC-type heme-binding CxxCH protein [Pirellulales bacterium]